MRSRAVLYCLTLALSVGSVVAVASPISFTFVGTQQPSDAHNNTGASSFDGINCTPGGSSRLDGLPCVISSDGNPHTYQPFYAKIYGDQAIAPGVWNLEIQTNAPLDYGDSASKLAFGDALLRGGGPAPGTDPLYWGISIGSGQTELNPPSPLPSQSTKQGDLYEVGTFGNGHPRFFYDSMYLTPMQLLGVSGGTGRGNEPIWINPNPGDSFGNPFMSDVSDPKKTAFNIATPGCATNVVDAADPNCFNPITHSGSFQLYTITDTFTAPQAFSDMLASGVFSFEFSSFICANGMIIGNGSSVPEPRAVSFFALGILLLGYRLTRWRKAQVS